MASNEEALSASGEKPNNIPQQAGEPGVKRRVLRFLSLALLAAQRAFALLV